MLRFALAVFLLVAVPPASADVPPVPGARIDVERVSFDQREGGLVARVQTSDRVRAYSIDQADGALTLVLYRAQLAPAVAQASSVWPVRGYRLGADADKVTVRFEVDEGVSVRAYPDRDSDDLLVSFSAAPQPRRTQWGGGVASESVASEPVVREPVAERPAPTPRRAVPAEDVAPTPPAAPGPIDAAGAEHWRLDTIVLDAGHGGHDAGGVGIGTTDRDVAFAVVRALGPMIERELGVNVVYTRDTDTFVEVRDRGRIANQEGGKLFISVHGNAGPSSAYGTETFFLAPRGSARASEVMKRENAVIELESDPSYYADFADGGDILRSLAMSAYQEESQHLATLIEGEFVRAGRRSRGVKQDNFMVLWAASMPAVLVEVGFVTNPDEARLLSSRAGIEQTARALFNAVRAYKESYERGLRAAQ
ncbi:N-acetylmuramoyl-L-alanine amidase family protein [Rubrivirga sp. IMCC45206]|uniref:N-acetylmuramoyl-L-alanine amidase family protein n=1 Tax=Rubrivirga sp. IMCC45206 TaxID=3391614 RepID=UPI00398FD973